MLASSRHEQAPKLPKKATDISEWTFKSHRGSRLGMNVRQNTRETLVRFSTSLHRTRPPPQSWRRGTPKPELQPSRNPPPGPRPVKYWRLGRTWPVMLRTTCLAGTTLIAEDQSDMGRETDTWSRLCRTWLSLSHEDSAPLRNGSRTRRKRNGCFINIGIYLKQNILRFGEWSTDVDTFRDKEMGWQQ